MPRTPNEIGDDFERRVEKALAGERVKQSGGGRFWKLDVRGRLRQIVSCKATTKPYIRITDEMILEAKEAARGMRGTGDGYSWAIAAEIAGTAVMIVPLDDYAHILTDEIDHSQLIPPSKAAQRRALARGTRL